MYEDQAGEFVFDIGDERVKNTQWFSYLKALLVWPLSDILTKYWFSGRISQQISEAE